MEDSRFENVSEELKAKAVACKSPEEVLELAQSEGVELSLEELDGAAGGVDWNSKCQSDNSPC